MSFRNTIVRWRYKYVPDHLLGEILAKDWIDNLVPFFGLLISISVFGYLIPNFYSFGNVIDTTRQLSEFIFVTYAMALVMLAGGIDLSVGSTFALGNIIALILLNVVGMPAWIAIPTTIACCASVGLINGILIGYLRLRAFLTTLATLILIRAVVDWLLLRYATDIAMSMQQSALMDELAEGMFLGLPISFWIAGVFGVVAHIFLSRTRPGWHIMAIGGSRKSAYNVGITVNRTICLAYVGSGALCGVAGVLYAARLGSAGSGAGVGLEVMALTAAVIGGNALGGGRGSVAKATMGAIIVLTITNGLVRIGFQSGAGPFALGLILLLAIAIDVRWLKNKHKLLSNVYLSPAYLALPTPPSTEQGSDSPFAVNDRLRSVELIGLGNIEGPEDVILDRNDNLYCGSRQGDIVRFLAPDYREKEIFAHVGGVPLGMAFDREDNLLVCIGGMGLYGVRPDREVYKLSDETNRSPFSIVDDSRLRIADDLDIAPDGRVFFSEATVRYEAQDFAYDSMEGRGNGRLICYDPRKDRTHTVLRNRIFPNGVCLSHDGKSVLFAETWACKISRYWLEGPKAGKVECVIEALPGYPDNINRASDGTYWLAMIGMRTPAMDLSLEMPSFRKRMSRRLAHQDLLFPNINTGCVGKFDETGTVLETLWDLGGENHPMITSMREHKGYLYLGGLYNNRIGRYRIPGADPAWTGVGSYWGER